VVNYLLEEIEVFTCGHTPYDDLTLLAASWSPDDQTLERSTFNV